jgi:hypothetical protein
MENDLIYSDRLENFTPIGYVLWAFGNFVVLWYIFPRFGILYQENSGNPERGSAAFAEQLGDEFSRLQGVIFSAAPRETRVARCHYFRNQNTNFGIFWKALERKPLKNLCYINGHLVYFIANRCICGYLVHFTFWYILPRKIWQPCERLIPFR